jgi:hypothetical protein
LADLLINMDTAAWTGFGSEKPAYPKLICVFDDPSQRSPRTTFRGAGIPARAMKEVIVLDLALPHIFHLCAISPGTMRRADE